MADIDENIVAYDEIRQKLEADHMGKWALLCNRELVSIFDSSEQAAETAVQKFGRGPYLIRQIGAPPLVLPASVMYHPDYGNNKMRL
ncbi:MAG: hypothetical protein LAP38_16180 [Acidobacteriia bacterium]|nr:hypothetical protein [Terriglobia bacterium]